MVVRNLMLADWFDGAHKESILNPERGKWARELHTNIRQACCVAGQCAVEVRLRSTLAFDQIL
jgi:hypothetical protein